MYYLVHLSCYAPSQLAFCGDLGKKNVPTNPPFPYPRAPRDYV